MERGGGCHPLEGLSSKNANRRAVSRAFGGRRPEPMGGGDGLTTAPAPRLLGSDTPLFPRRPPTACRCALPLGRLRAHLLQPSLQRDGVGAGGDELEPLPHERLCQHARGGGAVPRLLIRLARNLHNQPRADVVPRVLELNVAGDGHAVVDHLGHPERALKHDVPALGPEGHLDRVGHCVDPGQQRCARLVTKRDLGRHARVRRGAAEAGGHTDGGRADQRGRAAGGHYEHHNGGGGSDSHVECLRRVVARAR
eukprot:scaffold15176_cov102-Isochrysis_galbana.AAC.4